MRQICSCLANSFVVYSSCSLEDNNYLNSAVSGLFLNVLLFYAKKKARNLLAPRHMASCECGGACQMSVTVEEVFHVCTPVSLSSVVDNTVAAEIPLLIDSLEYSGFQINTLLLAKSRTCCSEAALRKTKTLWFAWMSLLSVISLDLGEITYKTQIAVFHQASGDTFLVNPSM